MKARIIKYNKSHKLLELAIPLLALVGALIIIALIGQSPQVQ